MPRLLHISIRHSQHAVARTDQHRATFVGTSSSTRRPLKGRRRSIPIARKPAAVGGKRSYADGWFG